MQMAFEKEGGPMVNLKVHEARSGLATLRLVCNNKGKEYDLNLCLNNNSRMLPTRMYIQIYPNHSWTTPQIRPSSYIGELPRECPILESKIK